MIAGTITATIRIGHRNIETGGLMFKAAHAGYLPLVVAVDHVIKTTWLGLSDHDARLAGYPDAEVAREDMMLRYPETKPDTPFTVIRFSRGV